MFEFVNDTFRFTGQPLNEWPNWLIFQNFATDEERTKIVVHTLFQTLTIHRGDLVVLDSIRQVHAIPPSDRASTDRALAMVGQTR